jgi:beta-ureidopropionase / N-carbamoyl-L-amino-acid hydrolase
VTPLRVNSERLAASLQALGHIGSYYDEASGLTGVNRLALTAVEGQGRRHVVGEMKALGLEVSVDPIGNVYGLLPGREDLAPVMIGSHIDTVPTAGIYDGCLGVLAGLEIVRVLQEAGRVTRRPLVVGFFTEEEGCRFGTDMLGSAVATGRISLADAYALTDRDGVTVKDALEAIDFLGDAPAPRPHAFLEVHIEQGPVLERGDHEVGLVTGVQAIRWEELLIRGRSAHAGTTPIDLRRDAGWAAALINVTLREMCRSGDYGDMRATVGQAQYLPGRVNVIPNQAKLTVDLRNLDDEAMQRAVDEVSALYARLTEEEGVSIERRVSAQTETVRFDPRIRERMRAAAERLELDAIELVSGAGHDVQEWARVCPAGLVFARGEYEGISHNPREHSTPEQCALATNVLLEVALELLEEE